MLASIFVLLIVIIFLALEVDISWISMSQVAYKRAAAITALSSLKQYWDSALGGTGTVAKRNAHAFATVCNRSQQIAALRGIAPLIDSIAGERRNIVCDNSYNFEPDQQVAGVLRLGHWYFREPAIRCENLPKSSAATCPCPNGKWDGPCFVRLPEGSKELASAAQLELFPPRATPIRTLFAKLIGRPTFSFRVRATASLMADTGIISSGRIVENVLVDADMPFAAEPPPPAPEQEKPQQVVIAQVDKEVMCKSGQMSWDIAGIYHFVIPAGCHHLKANLWGAGGAAGSFGDVYPDSDGGGGGFVSGQLEVTAGEEFEMIVGSGGKNTCNPDYTGPPGFGGQGGETERIGAGGGASSLSRSSQVLLVAAGGGAGGSKISQGDCTGPKHGGAGGGLSGQDGITPKCFGKPAQGASESKAGSGQGGDEALNGAQLRGGAGGGGGGYFGGGGADGFKGGAAGGSSYFHDNIDSGHTHGGNLRIPGGTKEIGYQLPASEGGQGVNSCNNGSAHGRAGLVWISWR